jgi:hypothetical protein
LIANQAGPDSSHFPFCLTVVAGQPTEGLMVGPREPRIGSFLKLWAKHIRGARGGGYSAAAVIGQPSMSGFTSQIQRTWDVTDTIVYGLICRGMKTF